MMFLLKNCVIIKCDLLVVTMFVICVKSAPYMTNPDLTQMQHLDQFILNRIAQQSLQQWIMQNQYNSVQQQLMALHPLEAMRKTHFGPVPYKLPQEPTLILVPSTIGKTTNRLENLNNNYAPDVELGIGDEDSVIINAENEANVPETNIVPQRAILVMPNGQRLIIGSIISAIPFLPFEVNVPDTISWIYNGIAGIIGGIGQRLPFRPRPTTESPIQQNQESMSSPESMTPNQGSIMLRPEAGGMIPTEESSVNLLQKLLFKRPSMGMPILMMPLTQTMPMQV